MKKKQSAGLRVPPQQMVKLSEVKPAPYNPRIVTAEHVGHVKASLEKNGMILNLVVQRSSPKHGDNVMVGGHVRLKAARELCQERGWPVPEEFPAVVLDLTDREAMQLNVSLNRIDAEFDDYKLGAVLAMIREEQELLPAELDAMALSDSDAGELLKLVDPPDAAAARLEADADLSDFGRSITLSLECSTVEARDGLKEALKILTPKGGKAGDVVLKMARARLAADGPRHQSQNGKAKKGADRGASARAAR